MMKISTNFLLLFFICLFFSCKKDNASIDLLRQAQNIAESKPNDALILLDSISNPEDMDKDNYMQYIVTHLQAKQKAQEDITNDTLIFEAQRYFDKQNNAEQAALAHYLAGRVYRAKDLSDKALKCFLQSESYALQFNNYVLAGKDMHIIGNLYFEQGIMDAAIALYKKAFNYYDKGKDTDKYKMQIINEIGRAYDEIENIDSSFVYFQKAMEYAEKLDDQEFKSILYNNLGYTYLQMKDYDKASDYLYNSLRLLPISDATNRIKTDINLACLYIYTSQPDSVQYYIKLSEKELAEIKDNILLWYLYNSLLDSFKQKGDYKQALYYKELGDSAKNLITKKERPLLLLKADKDFHLEQKDKQVDQSRGDTCIYFFVIIVVCISLLIFAVCVIRVHRKDKEEINLQAEKYRKIKDQLRGMSADEYKNLEAEIAAMLDDENEKK